MTGNQMTVQQTVKAEGSLKVHFAAAVVTGYYGS